MSIEIRRATAADFGGVEALIATSDRARGLNLDQPTSEVDRPKHWPPEADPTSFVLVAIDTELDAGAATVGYLEGAIGWPPKPDAAAHRTVFVLDDIIVAASHPRRGVGLRLITAMEAWAAEHGCKELILGEKFRRTVEYEFYEAITIVED